jgi:hypothetical protein
MWCVLTHTFSKGLVKCVVRKSQHEGQNTELLRNQNLSGKWEENSSLVNGPEVCSRNSGAYMRLMKK